MVYRATIPTFLGLLLTAGLAATSALADQTEGVFGKCRDEPGNFISDTCWLRNWAQPHQEVSKREFKTLMKSAAGKTTGTLSESKAPWAANYLPWKSGGVARRFGPDLGLPAPGKVALEDVKTMSRSELSRLSPIEKFDILEGNLDFRATKHELTLRGKSTPGVESWEGFCNGMRAAGALAPEPIRTVERTVNFGGASVIVQFSPRDLKALLGVSYFYVEDSKYGQAGKNQAPVNPGTLDIALRGLIGTDKTSFFVDVNTSEEIWNEAVVGFDRDAGPLRKLVDSDRAPTGAETRQNVHTTLYLLGEARLDQMNKATRELVSKRSSRFVREVKVKYVLFLNKDGTIVDARWSSPAVDSIWFAAGRGADADHSSGIEPTTQKPFKGNKWLNWEILHSLVGDSINRR